MGEPSVGRAPCCRSCGSQELPEQAFRKLPPTGRLGRHWNCRSRSSSNESVGEHECHVAELLHRKICDTPLHLGDVHTLSLDDACVRYRNRGGKEKQRQAERNQDNWHNKDSVTYAHDSSPVAVPLMGLVLLVASDLPANCFSIVSWIPQNGFIGRTPPLATLASRCERAVCAHPLHAPNLMASRFPRHQSATPAPERKPRRHRPFRAKMIC